MCLRREEDENNEEETGRGMGEGKGKVETTLEIVIYRMTRRRLGRGN